MAMRPAWVFDQYDVMCMLLWVEAGLLSALSVLVVVAYITWYNRKPPSKARPAQNPIILCMFSLFVADFILGIGATLSFRWLQLGQLNDHNQTFCIVQGVLMTLGNLSVVLNNLAITIHTFVVVWWSKTDHASLRWPSAFFIAIIWMYTIVLTAIGYSGRISVHDEQDIDYSKFKLSTFECLAPRAPASFQTFGIENWYWATLGLSVIVYVLLFLYSRSFIARDKDRCWKITWIPKCDRPTFASRPAENAVGPKPVNALFFLLYPLVTIIFYAPTLITGLRPAKGFVAQALYTLCGFFDVLLFWFFRKGLLEAPPPPQPSSEGQAPPMGVGNFFNGRNNCCPEV